MTKAKKIPMRQCAGCGMRKEKKELIRVIRTPEGEIVMDITGKKNGRGVYLCNDINCLNKARKKNTFARSLKTDISSDTYDEIEKEMIKSEDG